MSAKQSGARRSSRRARSASTRPTSFYVVLGAIVLAGVAGLGYVALRPAAPGLNPQDQLPPDLATAGEAQPYLLGSPDAPVTIEEFADYECPSCARFETITFPDVRSRIIETGRANLRYYDLPLPQHRHSYPASHAAACADEQGRFWEMKGSIYAAQDRWNTQVTNNPRSIFRDAARALGLNVEQWEQCYDSRKYQGRIDANAAEAMRRGVASTPTFIINGQPYRGSYSYDAFNRAVQEAATVRAGASGGGDTAR